MSDLQINQAPSPSVDLQRIGKIKTYEVMETDLTELDQVVGDASQSLGFWTFLTGIAISTGIAWKTARDASDDDRLMYAFFTFVPAVLAVFFIISWVRKSRRRPAIMCRIRGEAPPKSDWWKFS